LPDPVRQRLVGIAADVLGRLSPEQIPAALRAVARFTPARRARLAAPSLTATLDNDEDFRGRVADVVVQSAPVLAEAIRSGTSTEASDPVDVAVLAYLIRPDGWRALVESAGQLIDAGRRAEQDSAAQAEVDRLRAELAATRAAQRGELARVREDAEQAGQQRAAELGELRARVRAQGDELRALGAELAGLRAELDAAREQAAAATTGRELDARRSRSRIVDLERSVEAARRGARIERDVDDVRLWLLLDTLGQAAASLRRELSLPAASVRPADLLGQGGPDGGDPTGLRSAADPAALDRLLELPNPHVIVDGYNVTKTGYPQLPLADQRARLVGALGALVARSGAELTVVFDGAARTGVAAPAPRGVRVLFSEPGEIADDVIRRLVAAEPAGRPLLVVSSDHAVQLDVQGAGAWVIPSAVLLARLR
jgi:predicted RNA-binding protein with PIN domain